MEKNDIVRLAITGYNSDGIGVGRDAGGMVVFVPGAAAGDECDVRIVKVLSNYAFAKIETLLSPSPARADNDCPSFPACGGCAFRHISYEEELKWKKETVASALTRIGGVDAGDVDLIPAAETRGYRNKAVYPIKSEGGRIAYGFYRAGSHRLVPAGDCRIQPPVIDGAAKAFCSYMESEDLAPYGEESGKGDVRGLLVRAAEKTGELMLCPIFASKRNLRPKRMAEALPRLCPGVTSLFYNLNAGKNNSVLGGETIHIWGKPRLTERLCGLELGMSPESFFQVNTRQCEALYGKVLEFAGCAGDLKKMRVMDLFCGVGSIALFMARHCAGVAGIETIAAAVENARQNAESNGIKARFEIGDANRPFDVLPDFSPDLIIADPPRKGLDGTLIRSVAEGPCGHFIYVSCDPATLARDVRLFGEVGFSPVKIAAVDMFPRTAHVECVVLLNRK